jgi:hypothetical protein
MPEPTPDATTPEAEPATYPVLAARISQQVADDARDLIARIREADDPRDLRKEGAEGVVKLTEIGLEAFFLRPVVQAGLGSVTAALVRVGLKSAGAAIAVFVRRIVGGLSGEQMLIIADLVEERIVDLVDDEDEEETPQD